MGERDPDDLRAISPDDLPGGESAPEVRSGSRLRRVAIGIVAVVVLAALGWVGASLLLRRADETGEVPLIAADMSPVKQRPEEPGGETVPNQDMLVYGTLDPGSQAEIVERLLPPPEEPEPLAAEPAEVAPAEPAAGATAETGIVEGGEEQAAAATEAEPEAEPAGPDITSLLEETEPDAVEASAEPEIAATTEAETPLPAAPPRGWRVQIAAFKERSLAEAEWTRLAKRHADLLAGLSFAIEGIDLGPDKGIYHRLQVGSFEDRGAADTLCSQLKTRKVDCLVVKR